MIQFFPINLGPRNGQVNFKKFQKTWVFFRENVVKKLDKKALGKHDALKSP